MVHQQVETIRTRGITSLSRRAALSQGLGWLLSCAVLMVSYFGVVRPDLRLWRGVVTHGPTDGKRVALTFDDGPHPVWTPLLADTLGRHGAHGAFFVVGMEAQVYPELIAELGRGGHEVANHSLTHPYPNLTVVPENRIDEEIYAPARLLRQLTGQAARDFRPPGGGVDNTIIQTLKAASMRMVCWSANVGDASTTHPLPPQRIEDRLRRACRPGAIVLLHQRENTTIAVERYFTGQHRNVYDYETVSTVQER